MAKILLVGCGKMGGAMLEGWLSHGIAPGDITILEPASEWADALQSKYSNIRLVNAASEIEEDIDVLVLAVKPQMMDDVLVEVAPAVGEHTLALSIAAGRTIASMKKHLADNVVIRAMPNLPATIGKGVTVAVSSDPLDDAKKSKVNPLLEAVGSFYWVDDEALLDTVTGISGSGPAYIFYFIEALEQIGKEMGLSDELAKGLAYATVCGSADFADESEHDAATLREQVTSPNGTTQAGLEVLMAEGGLKEVLRQTVQAAVDRSKELSN